MSFTITTPDDCGGISKDDLVANYEELARLAACLVDVAAVEIPKEFHQVFSATGQSAFTVTENSGTLPATEAEVWVFLNGIKQQWDRGTVRYNIDGSDIEFKEYTSGGVLIGDYTVGSGVNTVFVEIAFFYKSTMGVEADCLVCTDC
jgi:hypothetical protein